MCNGITLHRGDAVFLFVVALQTVLAGVDTDVICVMCAGGWIAKVLFIGTEEGRIIRKTALGVYFRWLSAKKKLLSGTIQPTLHDVTLGSDLQILLKQLIQIAAGDSQIPADGGNI